MLTQTFLSLFAIDDFTGKFYGSPKHVFEYVSNAGGVGVVAGDVWFGRGPDPQCARAEKGAGIDARRWVRSQKTVFDGADGKRVFTNHGNGSWDRRGIVYDRSALVRRNGVCSLAGIGDDVWGHRGSRLTRGLAGIADHLQDAIVGIPAGVTGG